MDGEIIDVLAAAHELQEFCTARGWSFCFIGGLAVQCWSEPRVTNPADLSLFTGFGGETLFIDALLTRYPARHPEVRHLAETRRVLLLQTESGVGLDVALAAFPFEKSAIARSRLVEFSSGITLRVCSPEDLIVFKAFAARALDWRDIEMTLARQSEAALDWDYIRRELRPLVELKEAPELLDQLEALRRQAQR